MLESKKIKVKDLEIGMLCNLEGDKYADSENHDNRSTIEFEFVPIVDIERETSDCIAVTFDGYDKVGFPPNHEIQVKQGMRCTVYKL